MKYVPAEQLEGIIIEKLKQMTVDKKVLDEIVARANLSPTERIAELERIKKLLKINYNL